MKGLQKEMTFFIRKMNVKRFSNESTMHGFKELYSTKKTFSKIFWSFIVIASVGVTAYQVVKSIQQFIEQPTVTTIQPLEKGKMLYPPFSICYKHWSFWVDLDKVKNLNISKSTLHFGLSYADRIFSRYTFDLNKSEENFNHLMQKNNWTYLREFYSSISLDSPITLNDGLSFTERGFLEASENSFFCYTTSGSDMADLHKKDMDGWRKSKSQPLQLKIKKYHDPPFGEFLTEDEYYMYVREDLEKKDNYSRWIEQIELDELYNPHILLPNFNLDPIELNSYMDIYRIKFRTSVHKWQSSKSVNCIKGEISNPADETCETKCNSLAIMKSCKWVPLLELYISKADKPSMTCRQNIYFMDHEIKRRKTIHSTPPQDLQYLENCQCDYEHYYNESESCECMDGCEKWDFEFNVIEKTDRHSKNEEIRIFVEYPAEDSTLVISEIDSQSWETFIANVGGLLGIWLGASIVSFIQTIYLCCFTEVDDSELDEVVVQNFDKEKVGKVILNTLH